MTIDATEAVAYARSIVRQQAGRYASELQSL